tara:strand:+ start:75 stop:881 length:807 start_codon:yes stop_codon:yes gene_type:complete
MAKKKKQSYKEWEKENFTKEELEAKFQQELQGDVEFSTEVINRLKKMQPDEPIDLGVRIGLDAYAFDKGLLSDKEFKERLLNYAYIDKIQGWKTKRGTRIQKATYDPNKDLVTVTKGAGQYERDPVQGPPEEGKQYVQERYIPTTRSIEKGKFRSMIHEFRHRGNVLLNKLQYDKGLFGNFFRGSTRNLNLHADTDYDDIQMNKALGIREELPESEKKREKASRKGSKKRRKIMKKIYDKNKVLQDRYPGAYNRGGKVYANQPRKVRI